MTSIRQSLEGQTVRMARTGTKITVGPLLGEGGQAVVHAAEFGTFPCAVKWYRDVPWLEDLRRNISALAERKSPHQRFVWPIDVVVSDELPRFGYVMPRLEPGFASFAELLGYAEQPKFRTMITIGRHLVEAFQALHATGQRYCDISFGNLWVHPGRAEVAIIDNDNVGLDSDPVFVWGTPPFMAPEVVRRETQPSGVTDLFSLAVFLFYLFVHGHPLDGMRTEATFSWAAAQGESERALMIRDFGTDPLFVFDPRNDANRPPPGDRRLIWWPTYPRFFRGVFEDAFTTGLLNATGAARVGEGVWRRALLRLGDCVSICTCRAEVFYDRTDPAKACWNCGQVPPTPLVLELPGGTLVLSDGAVVTPHHLHRDRDHGTVVAVAEMHPADPARVVLRNAGTYAWTMRPEGETAKTVDPGRRLATRPMTIDFGTVQGRISRG